MLTNAGRRLLLGGSAGRGRAKVGPARKRKKVEAMRIEETWMGVLRKKVLGWSRAVVAWRERGNGLSRTVVRRDKAKAEAARKTRTM